MRNALLRARMLKRTEPSKRHLRGSQITRAGARAIHAIRPGWKHWRADVDVKFTYLKEIPALVAALQQGVIDAALLTAPATLTAQNFGLKELLNVTELKIPFVQHAIGTTRSYISANPEVVRRFVRSAAEGLEFLRKNRADAVAIMSKYTKITDPAQHNEALDAYDKAWEKVPAPSQAAIDAVLASSTTPKAKNAKWDQFIDDRFIKELVSSGMFR